MQRHDNPFHDLWLTEILNPDEFVRMFSPLVVKNFDELYGTGNVVVRGTQGSGKSMLLNLLNTSTRIAYEVANVPYPGPKNGRPFIAAGTHLIRDNARIVASRLSELPDDRRRNWAATTFADYINYTLVLDLVRNIRLLIREQNKNGILRDQLPIRWSEKIEADFVALAISSDVWFGFLSTCRTICDLESRLAGRLQSYRRYFNFNSDLDPEVEKTKTGIGEPMVAVAEAMRSVGVVPADTLFFLRIDQHEELYALEKNTIYGDVFRQVINRALALRDSRVSYRVGTRHYAWDEQVRVWGSGAKLENMRDYVIVDLDEMFQRHENSRVAKPFDGFTEDVFRRRLEASGFDLNPTALKDPLTAVFGKSLTPGERALRYTQVKAPPLEIPSDWDPRWKEELLTLWKSGKPLLARLGEAWLRQAAQQRSGVHKNRDKVQGQPWRLKRYWLKERNEAALVQLAGAAIQSLVWSGRRHIVDLAGCNILAFMSICRSIWSAWLRNVGDEELLDMEGPPRIAEELQIVGISEASKTWFDKLREGLDGDRRTIFVSALGSWFSRGIREDRALSNPGHNGFSLARSEFGVDGLVSELIKSSRDHGDLIESEHTTKTADLRPRKKWYLNPLLCPYFRIPIVRTKEPIYTNIAQLNSLYLAMQSDEDLPNTKRPGRKKTDDSQQTLLF